MYIDTHCHLDREDYPDLESIMEELGSNIAIVSGVDDKTNKNVIKLINQYPNLYGTIGIHPDCVDDSNEESLKVIEDNINNPKIVGIGEIGLDYHYRTDNKITQLVWFKKQIDLANKYNKTIVIHSRDSLEDTKEVLINYKTKDHKCVLHCYSYDELTALELIEYNIMISINGIVTFKKNETVKKVLEHLDLSYILLETDSPYLAPVPFRGKRNDPTKIPYIASVIATIKDVKKQEVIDITTNNAIRQFDIK